MTIKGTMVYLRPASISDTELILYWENDKENWLVSDTIKPYSKTEISEFLKYQKGIHADKQLRLIVCAHQDLSPIVGCVDLFNYDSESKVAGIGVLISPEFRNKGYASEALQLLIKHSFANLRINKLYCHIHDNNTASLKLFGKNGFNQIETENNTLLFELTNR